MSLLRSRGLVVAVAFLAVLGWLGMRALLDAGGALAGAAATFTAIFLGLFIEALPFLLLGTLASGFVEVSFDSGQLARYVPHHPLRAALAGALLGLFLPVGECGVVPLTRRLLRKGVPGPFGIAFLLAAPVINPIVIASTLAAFGLGQILFLRIALTLLIAAPTGLLFAAQNHAERVPPPVVGPPMTGDSSLTTPATVTAPPQRNRRPGWHQALNIAVDEFFELGAVLVLGALLAALAQTVLPQAALLSNGSRPLGGILSLSGLATILSAGSASDAFSALSFAGTFGTGAVVAFLVLGPMVDLKNAALYLAVFRRRTVAALVLLPLVLNLVGALVLNALTAR